MASAWLLFALLWTLSKRPRREGILTLTFGLWYGVARIVEDSLRIDKRFGPFTGSQWTALAVAISSAGLLIWWAVHPRAPGDDLEGSASRDDAVSTEPEATGP